VPAAVALCVAALATVAFASPAAADVTVTPSTGTQGGALKLVFRLSEDRSPAYTTQVDVYLPAETPVAEVYPMSVPHWAPKVTMRTLDQPVEAIHGTLTSEVASIVTWTRVVDASGKPGSGAELIISLGPLPDADRMVFTVVQRYSDGAVVRWADPPATGNERARNPAPTLSLRPRAAAAPSHRHPSGGGPGTVSALVLSAAVTAALLGGWLAVSRVPRVASALRSTRSRLPRLRLPGFRSSRAP
jgi:uncharacterized protein YcnI